MLCFDLLPSRLANYTWKFTNAARPPLIETFTVPYIDIFLLLCNYEDLALLVADCNS
jgi:hypothetical protein